MFQHDVKPSVLFLFTWLLLKAAWQWKNKSAAMKTQTHSKQVFYPIKINNKWSDDSHTSTEIKATNENNDTRLHDECIHTEPSAKFSQRNDSNVRRKQSSWRFLLPSGSHGPVCPTENSQKHLGTSLVLTLLQRFSNRGVRWGVGWGVGGER